MNFVWVNCETENSSLEALNRLPVPCSVALHCIAKYMDEDNIVRLSSFDIPRVLKRSAIKTNSAFKKYMTILSRARLIKKLSPAVYMVTPEIYCKVGGEREEALREKFAKL